ncbi:hypothetical protein HGRIS_007009 [Hohenbuehelia grisea]|uniref:DNA-directed RNA polymerase n=1 Tax=Hohenbuehelia grisea TaxID=104357 RepID=A0ABR3JAW1_9AGAR
MIPRAARRCRRLYSAQAFAQVQGPSPEHRPYLPQSRTTPSRRVGPGLTVLPTPLPQNTLPLGSDAWYTDSPTQELIALIDVCLQNLYDVPRAKGIFDRLRGQLASSVLEPRVYNTMLVAYLDKAAGDAKKEYWFNELMSLYGIMEGGQEKVLPTESTYAVMLLAWIRHGPESPNPIRSDDLQSPASLLTKLLDRGISVPHVVSDRVFYDSKEASEVIQVLSKAAVDLNLSSVVSQLGMTETVGQVYDDPLEGVPEVRPVLVDKKDVNKDAEGSEGASQQEIPFNLFNLRTHLANVALARRVLPAELTARQKLLEESVYDVAVERLKHQADKFASLGLASSALNTPDLQKWMWDWHVRLQDRLEEAIKDITETEREAQEVWDAKFAKRVEMHKGDRVKALDGRSCLHPASAGPVPLAPFLQLVKPSRLSLITILEVMRLQGTGGVSDGMKTARALVSVGRAVEVEYKAQMAKRTTGSNASAGVVPAPAIDDLAQMVDHDKPADPTQAPDLVGKYRYGELYKRRVAARKFMEDGEAWTAEWTQEVRLKVGSILLECLMDVAEVERTKVVDGTVLSEQQPAFFHSYEYLRGQKLGVIRLNPVVAERIAKDGLRETLHPRHLPMVVRPKPWLGHDNGGYIYNKTTAMRFKDSVEQLAYLKHASHLGNVELVYAGLDVLGSTPWHINRPIFEVVLKVWNSGERLGKMPPAVYEVPEPERPDEALKGLDESADLRKRITFQTRHRAWLQAKANNHSDRCSVNYKIEIARAFLGDTIYLPHNLDFRGRAYPIPPHLNHIGDDLSRGLLKFAEAKPLGERGLRWLKIHLANLYGYDKAKFDERVDFVMERLDDVFDSATNPLEGGRWWTKADDPWQCLATCMELHAALTSPDPHAFESSLPVHQDGTCNGLQHYAALGGDARGAAQVNLAAADRPSDVYTYVGNMVEKLLEQDAEKGEKYAIMLKGKISRKVVKQTVMTTVYGVTYIGAREQIEKQLKDRKDLPQEECWAAAAYLAKQVLTCIGDLFSGAKGIQTWLNICARLVSKSVPAERLHEAISLKPPKKRSGRPAKAVSSQSQLRKEQMTSVVWTTPLGLPIVQPYRKPKRKQISTSIQTVYISDPNSPAEVNSVKQASAFPPNFIHSLDATHMILTALECRTQGLTFASVHDSYWTHACSIDTMSAIIRDTFIALHSSDVLEKLNDEFHERYKNYKVPLTSLRSSQLVKHLKEAGSKLVVPTQAAAKKLGALSELAVVSSEEETTIGETETSSAVQSMLEGEVTGKGSKSGSVSSDMQSLVDMLASEEDAEVDEEDEGLSRKAKAEKKKKEKDVVETIALMGKFVNLVDIIPPLPKKGDFNVEAIKGSQYFFS